MEGTFFSSALSRSRHQQAGSKHPGALVLGRMSGCQLRGGKEQWLFHLLFIAKPIWEEGRQEDLRRASFPWGLAHLPGRRERACALSGAGAGMLAHAAAEPVTCSGCREGCGGLLSGLESTDFCPEVTGAYIPWTSLGLFLLQSLFCRGSLGEWIKAEAHPLQRIQIFKENEPNYF